MNVGGGEEDEEEVPSIIWIRIHTASLIFPQVYVPNLR